MRRDKVEFFGRRSVGIGKRKHAHRDQVRLVVFVNGGYHQLCPLSEDVIAAALPWIQAQPLAEFHVTHPTRVPSVSGLPCCGWFVHQVVGKDRWAFCISASDGFPEKSLRLPAILLR